VFSLQAAHKLYKVAQLSAHQYEAVVLAGTGNDERGDAGADECSFYYPSGIAVHEPSNTCFISDNCNHAIRKVLFATPYL